MEYILMAVFGGGVADWSDIGATYYDWDEIFDRAKSEYGLENTDINTLYGIILDIALDKLSEEMQNYVGEKSGEFEDCSRNIKDYFEIFTNCLDTHLWFRGSEELGQEIQEKLENEIEQINHDIAFTYIDFCF